MTKAAYESRAWRKLTVAAFDVYGAVCYYPKCDHPGGRDIDRTLGRTARWGPTVDHLNDVKAHGTDVPPLSMVRPCHRRCNSRRAHDLARQRAAVRVRSPYW